MADLIEIEGPDGVIYEFPKGTSDDVMKGAMRRQFGEPAPEREPTPGVGARIVPGMPGVGSTIVPIIEWFQNAKPEERQALYDFIGSGGGAAAGTVAAAPAGPPGMVIGGGGGAVAGKVLARGIGPFIGGTGDEPTLTEGGIDAGAGAFGPVAGPLLRGGAKLLTGLSRQGVTEVERQVARATARATAQGDEAARAEQLAAERLPNTSGAPQLSVERGEMARKASLAQSAPTIKQIAELKPEKIREAVEAAVARAKGEGLGEVISRAVPGAIGGALMFEPTIGMLIGAGVSDAVLKRFLPRLLSNQYGASAFSKWALNVEKNTPQAKEIAASFMALAAEQGLIEHEREPPRATSRPQPLGRRSERPRPPRDERGRFVGIDHSELERMFS